MKYFALLVLGTLETALGAGCCARALGEPLWQSARFGAGAALVMFGLLMCASALAAAFRDGSR